MFDPIQIRQEMIYGEVPGTTYVGTSNEWVDYWFQFSCMTHVLYLQVQPSIIVINAIWTA